MTLRPSSSLPQREPRSTAKVVELRSSSVTTRHSSSKFGSALTAPSVLQQSVLQAAGRSTAKRSTATRSTAQRSLLSSLLLLLASCAPQPSALSLQPSAISHQPSQLLIIQTSDTHSCIEPDSKTNTGGYVRRAALIDSLRTHVDPDLLLFDCGDYSQGSLYYNLFQGETEVRLMNTMRYDAATIGNHEFDFGEDNMLRLFQMATFPTVCCNYDVSATCLKDAVRPYTVIRRKGLRIGVFGVCPPLEGLIAEKNCEGIRYLDPIAEANRIIPILRGRERCDVVICLSHLGWQVENLIDDVEFIAGTRGIDLVLGGHTHSNFDAPVCYPNLDGDSIPLMHNGKNASHLGRLTLTVRQNRPPKTSASEKCTLQDTFSRKKCLLEDTNSLSLHSQSHKIEIKHGRT